MDAARRFWDGPYVVPLLDNLDAPLHLVLGNSNHDVGDKQIEWAPAEPVGDLYLELYQRTFGASHFSFDHRGCHFIVINTVIINSGQSAEQVQREWLEHDLAKQYLRLGTQRPMTTGSRYSRRTAH